MSNSTNKTIGTPVSILDKKFVIACPEHAQESLHCVATLLDTEMREIRKTGRVIGTDRIAIIAALNIIHELTLKNEAIVQAYSQNNESTELTNDLQDKLSILAQKIDEVLYPHVQTHDTNTVCNTAQEAIIDSPFNSSLDSSFDPMLEPTFEATLEKEYAD